MYYIEPVIDPVMPPDPDGSGSEDCDECLLPPVPDSVDLVVEVATMMSVFSAQRFVRIDFLRREQLIEANARGAGVLDIVGAVDSTGIGSGDADHRVCRRQADRAG